MEKNDLLQDYPVVGSTIYYVDCTGDMHEEVVLKIEDEYLYVELHEHGGAFVTIDDILDPLSEEVQEYRKKTLKDKIDNVVKQLKNPDIYCEFRKRLSSSKYRDDAVEILNILTKETI